MDMELHAHGLGLLDKHVAQLTASGRLEEMPGEPESSRKVYRKPMAYKVPQAYD